MSMKFWNVRKVSIVLLSAFAASAFAQTAAQGSATVPTLADAHKAYVAGNWKEAADAYEVACPKEPDSLRAECYLWDILALSQTGNSKLFKVAGHRLDSLINTTSPEKQIYSEMLLTKAQFMLYMGKNARAAEILIQAIDNSKPEQAVVLQKVCSAVLSRAPHQDLDTKCKSVKDSSLYKTAQAKPAQASPAAVPEPKPVAAAPATPAKPVAPAPVVEPTPTPAQKAATEPKPTPKPETKIPDGAPYWTLQLGAFGVEANAKLLAENMQKQGLESRIETRIGETRTLFLVQTGKFPTKEAAMDFGAQKLAPLKMDFQAVQKK
ncbi:MAG: SPOR domain-containing protein [Fibrobacter sp.]|nr:SPOR domain-containing protein [Fibrobacter sp.]